MHRQVWNSKNKRTADFFGKSGDGFLRFYGIRLRQVYEVGTVRGNRDATALPPLLAKERRFLGSNGRSVPLPLIPGKYLQRFASDFSNPFEGTV
jgi:hypothetical protein